MNAVDVRDLCKRFGQFQVLDGVSFSVQPGEVFALLGPNGSGKTTSLKSIAGLLPPTSGNILVEGINVWREPRKAKMRFSYLPQRVAFPENLTAREVLEFYCRIRRVPAARVNAALVRAGLDGASCASKPVSAFSGGMTQRLGIAVALLAGTSILILDEPTASLDPAGADHLLETILDLKRSGATVVFSSHILSDVEAVADRAALLADGKLVAVERPGNLGRFLRPSAFPRLASGSSEGRGLRTAVRL